MKKVALFPGIDALMSFKLRAQAFNIPAVKEQIEIAQNILNSLGRGELNLKATMTEEFSANQFQEIVLCSVTTQVALFKEYEREEPAVDLLLGVSLGDLARSHCAGIVSFEEMLKGVLIFTQLSAKTIGKGETIYVKVDPVLSTRMELLELDKYDLEISVHQTKDIFLISGSVENIQLWLTMIATPFSILVRKIFPMQLAIHNKLMNPVADGLNEYLESLVKIKRPKYPIFSTILTKMIENGEEIKDEMIKNVKSPVYFYQAIQKLIETGEKFEFINIGPSPTMLNFISHMELDPQSIKMTDHFKQTVQKSFNEIAI